MPSKPSDLIVEARERWNRCDEAEQAQRKRMLLAKQFRAGDQWPDAVRKQREGAQAISGQGATPARPCLTIDRLSQPCRQVSNTIKGANFAIDVLPNGYGADTETAEIGKGYLRYVQNRARGESPVEWAADGAIEGGLGWVRLRTDYVHQDLDGIPPEAWGDLELLIERITNNLSVYCDPFSVKPTRRDARFMFVTEDLSKDEFTRRYPTADLASLDEWSSTGDPIAKAWCGPDTVRIAEYWRVENDVKTIELPDGRTRTVSKPIVRMSKVNAVQELPNQAGEPERFEWVGTRIPLFPVLGEELNIDGKSHLRGIIEEGMDAQRMVNYTYSGAVEMVALASKDAPMVPEDSIADYKAIWQTRNIYNYAYLPYKPVNVGGSVERPHWETHEPPIQALAHLLNVSEEAIKATTGVWDESLGKSNDKNRSGRAIQALQGQSDLGSSNYPDNVRRMLIDLGDEAMYIIPRIIRPGQMLQILGVDDAPKQVIIGQPHLEGQNGQPPQPVAQGQEGQYDKGMVKFYDFSKGRYAVTVAVGKSYTTKREEGAAALGELIPSLPPPMAAAVAPEFIEELSFPGAHKIAEVARRALPPELQAPPDGEEAIPPQVKQQLIQAEQAIQALTQQVEQMGQVIQTEQVKSQAKLQETAVKEQAETQRAMLNAESQQRIDQQQLQLEYRKLEVQLEIEMAKLQNAAAMARADVEMDALHLHSGEQQAEADRAEGSMQADLDRQAAQEQQAMAAATADTKDDE